MPIILPKCPDSYELNKKLCRCKKITKIVKKTKKKAPKKETPKKAAPKTSQKLKTKLKLPTKSVIKSKKASPKKNCDKIRIKECAIKNKICNNKTNRCINPPKPKKKTQKAIPKKAIPKKNCNKTRIKECTRKNKICNNKTNRCINPPKSKKKTQKKSSISKSPKKTLKKSIWDFKRKDTRTIVLEEKLKSITALKSYSPSINKEILTLRSLSPHKDIFKDKCNKFEIFVPKKRGSGNKCYAWNTKGATEYLLDNLLSKTKLKGEDIIGPNQSWNNCWFNTFFVMFFISDLARKYTRHLRQSMITGSLITKNRDKFATKKLPKPVHKQFWLLNKFITASLLGRKNPSIYASLIDTNDVVKGIYETLPKEYKYVDKGEHGNPIAFYLSILNYIQNYDAWTYEKYPISYYKIYHDLKRTNDLLKKDSFTYNNIVKNHYHMLIIEISDGENKSHGLIKNFKKKLEYKIGSYTYKLDSIGVRNIKKNHICALLTINKEDYMFDGENFSPLFKKKWRHYLNKDKDFKITQNIKETYNLTKCYQCLVYYRTK